MSSLPVSELICCVFLFTLFFHSNAVSLCCFLYQIVIVFYHLQEHAFESSQKYKEGKYIIELAHMIKENGWD